MNNLKTNPKGIDAIINRIQVPLYDILTSLWGVSLNSYPRCYIYSENGIKDIQHYFKNKEYESVLYAENNKFFFTAENDLTHEGNNYYSTTIDLYFIINVEQIKSLSHRADEECVIDIVNILNENVNCKVTKVSRGFDNVFNRYDYRQIDDLEPYFICKIELSLLPFDINTQCILN